MMEKHLPKIFTFGVEKLRNEERQIEAEFDCVVPVDFIGEFMRWVVYPKLLCIPQPWFLSRSNSLNTRQIGSNQISINLLTVYKAQRPYIHMNKQNVNRQLPSVNFFILDVLLRDFLASNHRLISSTLIFVSRDNSCYF